MNFRKYQYQIAYFSAAVFLLIAAVIIGCNKNNNTNPPYAIKNFLTLFKSDSTDILPTDTIISTSNIEGKYIAISGNTGATEGLGRISFQLFTLQDSLLTSQEVMDFFRPDYHVFAVQLAIPKQARGEVYKIAVTSFDKDSNEIGKETFYGMDVLTCDPIPECIVTNQIVISLETPENTPDEPIYIS